MAAPATIAAAHNQASERRCSAQISSATAGKTQPAPANMAVQLLSRRLSPAVRQATAKKIVTIAPMRATLCRCSSRVTSPGTRAEKKPPRANAANAMHAGATNARRMFAGTPTRGRRSRSVVCWSLLATVSFTRVSASVMSTRPTISTTNTIRNGAGAYSASRPQRTPPTASPPRLPALAMTAARERSLCGSSSAIHAVSEAAPKPAAKPLIALPTNRPEIPVANKNTTALTIVSPNAISAVMRRPSWSDKRPKRNRTSRLPIAYTA